jgi:hypothetical protein
VAAHERSRKERSRSDTERGASGEGEEKGERFTARR